MTTKIYKLFGAAIVSVSLMMGFASCSPDSFEVADPSAIPTLDGVDFDISVDQETNQMVATYTPRPGTYPIWIINGTSYSTLQEVGYQNPEAGTYTIGLKLGNRNGFSQGTVTKTFTFNETKIDYTADFRRITGKEWRFANKEVAHLACGPAGTAATEWWSAGPNEKEGTGMYDDRMTFTADNRKGGTFHYSPGEDGLTYVNKGTTKWGTGADADFDASIGEQTADWSFEVYDWEDAEGNVTKQTYIQLAPNTAFPYISKDSQYENPKFRVEELTAKKLVLIYEAPDRSIAWRFIFTNGEDEPDVPDPASVVDWDPASPSNLWLPVETGEAFEAVGCWFANDGWAQIADPEWSHSDGEWFITMPDGIGGSQWQGQFHIDTKLTASAAKKYNFYLVMEADNDCPQVTFKLTDSGDDNYLFVERRDVEADKPLVFKQENVMLAEGTDASVLRMFFDFGGTPAGTHVKISKIYLEEAVSISYDDADNLWRAVDEGTMFDAFGYYFADDGWGPIDYSPATHSGDAYELTLPEGLGGSQWQGQFHIDTKLTASGSKAYHVQVQVEADADLPQVTFKLTDSGDNNFFFAERKDVAADTPNVFTWKNVKLAEGTDASALRFFFDFGGSPGGAHVKISKIVLKEA